MRYASVAGGLQPRQAPVWTHAGDAGKASGAQSRLGVETQGRGRMERSHQADGSARKLLFVYPLCPDVQQRLREARLPCFSEAAADRV
jgi:hypothetical protein